MGPVWHSKPTSDGLFIVRFKEYQMAAVHRSALEAALADPQLPPLRGTDPGPSSSAAAAAAAGWQWVDRTNLAARFPTDFGLLRLDATVQDALKVC